MTLSIDSEFARRKKELDRRKIELMESLKGVMTELAVMDMRKGNNTTAADYAIEKLNIVPFIKTGEYETYLDSYNAESKQEVQHLHSLGGGPMHMIPGRQTHTVNLRISVYGPDPMCFYQDIQSLFREKGVTLEAFHPDIHGEDDQSTESCDEDD
jgi:hypothetical protein